MIGKRASVYFMDVVFITSHWPDYAGIAERFRQDGHAFVFFDDPRTALDHMIGKPPRLLIIDYTPDPAASLILTKTARRLLGPTLIMVMHPQLDAGILIDLLDVGIDGYIAGQPTDQDILHCCKCTFLHHILVQPSNHVEPLLVLPWAVHKVVDRPPLDLTIHLLLTGYVWDFREVYSLVIRSDLCN